MLLSYLIPVWLTFIYQVIIVGAGPSGLLLALLLSKHGIPVHILEASHELDQQPRAAHYGPPAIPELERAGVLDEINRRGMRLNHMCWRRPEDHSVIAVLNGAAIANADGNGRDLRVACLPMQDLDAIMLEWVLERYGGTISWRHKVLDIGQDGDKAWAECDTPEGRKRFEADFIVGCDGANSQVRKSLFGKEFPGRTWDAQIIATNVSRSHTYYPTGVCASLEHALTLTRKDLLRLRGQIWFPRCQLHYTPRAFLRMLPRSSPLRLPY